MAVPKRIKVVDIQRGMFGCVADYLTIGKEYDVVEGSFGPNREDGLHILADNGVETFIAVGRDCAHGGVYEVVA